MNRAMRRLAARQKYYPAPTHVDLPKYLDEFTVFNDIDRVMEKIEHGEIEHANGVPIMLASNGEWCEVIPAMNGWISAWKNFDKKFQLNHDVSPLVRLCNCLNYAKPISEHQIKAARRTVNEQRRLFRQIPRDALASTARTEQIRILMEPATNQGATA